VYYILVLTSTKPPNIEVRRPHVDVRMRSKARDKMSGVATMS
jgi:hypothetical protein